MCEALFEPRTFLRQAQDKKGLRQDGRAPVWAEASARYTSAFAKIWLIETVKSIFVFRL